MFHKTEVQFFFFNHSFYLHDYFIKYPLKKSWKQLKYVSWNYRNQLWNRFNVFGHLLIICCHFLFFWPKDDKERCDWVKKGRQHVGVLLRRGGCRFEHVVHMEGSNCLTERYSLVNHDLSMKTCHSWNCFKLIFGSLNVSLISFGIRWTRKYKKYENDTKNIPNTNTDKYKTLFHLKYNYYKKTTKNTLKVYLIVILENDSNISNT